MKISILVAAGWLLIAAGLTVAQAEQRQALETVEGHGRVNYEGEVREFRPGNLLEIDIGDKRSKTYNLANKGISYSLYAGIAVGDKVKIAEGHDSAGNKIVEVNLRRKE